MYYEHRKDVRVALQISITKKNYINIRFTISDPNKMRSLLSYTYKHKKTTKRITSYCLISSTTSTTIF